MTEHKKGLPPPTAWDDTYPAVRAALSALLVDGSLSAELFAAIIASLLARRRDE